MEKLLCLLALLCTGHAVYQDLSEKVFVFPLEEGTSNVKLVASVLKPITALTVCMRFYSKHSKHQTLFSLALPSEPKAFVLSKPTTGLYRLYVKGTALVIKSLPDDTDEWNSVCWTWDSSNGLTTLWVNGKRSSRNILQPSAVLSGAPSVILGQDQDSYDGHFDQTRAFVGDIADVHLWDRVIVPCDIRLYMEGNAITPGNLLSWNNLQYSINGTVYVERSDFDKLVCY